MANTCRLRVIITDEFGNQTDVSIGMPDATLASVYNATRSALLGSEFHPESIDEVFPYIEEHHKTLGVSQRVLCYSKMEEVKKCKTE